jgi:putative hydrolase of the HAD superfamily
MNTANQSALVRFIRDHTQPLEPLPSGTGSKLQTLENIRGVVFDVYGTLIISGVGDISLSRLEDRDQSLKEAIEAVGFSFNEPLNDLSDRFHKLIKAHQEKEVAARKDLLFPEVEIRDVWEAFLTSLLEETLISGELTLARVAEAAVRFEIAVNPVYPMPGCRDVLKALKQRGLPVGIISNAQFFTPLLFEAFFDESLERLGVESLPSIWSYLLKEAKPSTRLYSKAAEEWDEHFQISPKELLYVGNDIRNDIWPARKVGFQTALFAGDKRSLRLREDDPDCKSVQPDLILTHLTQIQEILPA